MEKIFCPFVKGDCVAECVFNNCCFDEGDRENCNLNDAVDMIRSFGFADRTLESYLEKLESVSKNIDSNTDSIISNTGSDQSESYEINENLKEIIKLLKNN